MKKTIRFATVFLLLLFAATVLLGGCSNLQPAERQPAQKTPAPAPAPAPTPAPTPSQPTETVNYVVIYNYGSTGKVELSANNLTLKIGQKLTLQPAKGLTQNTRFTSSGENFFGDVMRQEPEQSIGRAVFTAIKAGKGKLQIIPNTDETARATDFWVTVEK